MALTIRARLTLWLLAVLALIVVVLGAFLMVRLRADLLGGLDSTLASRAQELAHAMNSPNESESQDVDEAPSLSGVPRGEAVAQILGPGGKVLQASGESESKRPLVSVATVTAAGGPYRRTIGVGGEPFRMLAVPIGSNGDVLVVASSMDPVDRAVRRLGILLLVGGPVAIALCGVGAYVLAGRALDPIDQMIRAAGTIGMDDTSARLDVSPLEDEVGRLGRTLNQMLARLDAGIREQRRFTADASHELRTPLAILAGEMDVAMDSRQTPPDVLPLLESYREEVGRMTRIVEDLLLLARFDEGAEDEARSAVDLLALAHAAADRLAAPAAAGGVRLSVHGRPVDVWGNNFQLTQLLTNLIDNAVKYTPGPGSVRVSVTANNGSAIVSVADSGVGIAAESVPHVFDRFYRVDKGRSRALGGTGLGLAICRAIVEAHHGTISMESSPGSGTTVTARFTADLDTKDAARRY